MFGYKCTLQTDTEVITYILDYLLRRQGLTPTEAANVIAAPFWSTIESKTDEYEREKLRYLRTVFPSLLITGPFSIVLGFDGGLMEPDAEKIWAPSGGEPVIVAVKEGAF